MFSRLLDMLSADMAVDLDTGNTVVYVKGRGIVLKPAPAIRHVDTVLKSLSSLLTIMPEPIPPADPWAQDLAALRGDMVTISRDAWIVIARHENERRQQEG